jgi:hypothetical protein
MKKLLLLCFSLSMAMYVHAQISITRSDMPVSGDTIRYSTASTATALRFDTTGANMIWHYDSLTPNGQGVTNFKSALAINLAYAALFGLNDYGLKTADSLNLFILTLKNLYSFYKTSNSYLEINGQGVEYSGIPIPTSYTIPDKIYQFPLTFGRIDTSAYDINMSIPTFGGLRQTGTRINTVDGWGTIYTPFGSFSCIRLKSVTNEIDSIHVTSLNLAFGIPISTTTYKWLANGIKIPVLEVAGNNFGGAFTPTSIKYRDNPHFIPPQFSVVADFRANLTTCTTADTITITNRNRPNPPGTSYQYTITPGTYTYVAGTGATSAAPKVVFNSPGLYTVSLYVSSPAGGSVPATADTTKTDYISVSQYTGIADQRLADMMLIYPNPADDHINCVLNGSGSNQISIEMIDIKGSIVFSKNTVDKATITIPTTNIAAGEYLLKTTIAEGESYVRKVKVQH